MLKLTLKMFNLFDTINQETTTFIRTPEPSEVCELDSMYSLADWLYWASQNNLLIQERYNSISEYLNTMPTVGESFRIVSNH